MIEYDMAKDEDNIRTRGLPLGAAELLFTGPFVEEEDARIDYGATRFVATGPIAALGDRIFVVVYTWRENIRRIISFRKAKDREIRKYRASNP